jgi:threonyl-tRNA synthetase
MYAPMSIEEVDYYLKPMNCPGHIMIYKSRVHSYRDCRSGSPSSGTSTATSGPAPSTDAPGRGFTQDDSHIFCTPEQVVDEAAA